MNSNVQHTAMLMAFKLGEKKASAEIGLDQLLEDVIRTWAREFEKKNLRTDWSKNFYHQEVENFLNEKLLSEGLFYRITTR